MQKSSLYVSFFSFSAPPCNCRFYLCHMRGGARLPLAAAVAAAVAVTAAAAAGHTWVLHWVWWPPPRYPLSPFSPSSDGSQNPAFASSSSTPAASHSSTAAAAEGSVTLSTPSADASSSGVHP